MRPHADAVRPRIAAYLAKAAGRNQVISSLFKAAGPLLTEAASRQL